MARRGDLQLKAVRAGRQCTVKLVVARSTEVKLHLLEVKNCAILPERREPEKPWKFRTRDGGGSDATQTDRLSIGLAESNWELAVVDACLSSLPYTADLEGSRPLAVLRLLPMAVYCFRDLSGPGVSAEVPDGAGVHDQCWAAIGQPGLDVVGAHITVQGCGPCGEGGGGRGCLTSVFLAKEQAD